MKIFKYTEAVQKLLKSKIKPEPWLHIAIVDNYYVIFIWDTRQVLGSGEVRDLSDNNVKGLASANDNKHELKGSGSIVNRFNQLFRNLYKN